MRVDALNRLRLGLLQSVFNLDQVSAIFHDFVDALIGSRYFIDDTGAEASRYAFHNRLQVLHSECLAGRTPRHAPGAVGSRIVRHRIAETRDEVAPCSPWNRG